MRGLDLLRLGRLRGEGPGAAGEGAGDARPRARASAAAIVPAFAVGLAAVLVRGIPILGSGGFPLNDGGLFYVMARDLQANSFLMPATTSYNGADIPFAYPPLGIYLVAFLHLALPVQLIDLFVWLPLALSLASVAAMFFLARQLLPTRFHALVATAAFAVAPQSYMWVIEGGGVTRGLGLLLALLAAGWTVRYLRDGRAAQGALAMLAGGLAVASHPNAALFAVLAVVLLGLQARTLGRPLRILIGMGVVSAPWWAIVAVRLGPTGLVSAGSLDGPAVVALRGFFELLSFSTTGEVFLPIVAATGFLGLLLCLNRRIWLLPVWLAVELLVDERLGAMYAMVPLCLAAGYGLADVVMPAFVRVSDYGRDLMPGELWRSTALRDGLLGILCIATFGSLIFDLSAVSPEHALPAATREAYQWVSDNTPAAASFAIITGSPAGTDGSQEWFPALTSRMSVATPQGVEWLGAEKWRSTYKDNVALQACASDTAECLLAWASDRGGAPQYVLLPKGPLLGAGSPNDCCTALRHSLLASGDFVVAYDGPGATIVRWPAVAARKARAGRESELPRILPGEAEAAV